MRINDHELQVFVLRSIRRLSIEARVILEPEHKGAYFRLESIHLKNSLILIGMIVDSNQKAGNQEENEVRCQNHIENPF